ncbi:MAG TPA: type II toxin-antitoxin system HicB family antitoxin [Burkholderiales bacterium]|jgi:predicted RNase H-like HicB family nuclease|nr:type II toxin-antitoxin system HicB family antitoxin [Burkholderiales bacterium]
MQHGVMAFTAVFLKSKHGYVGFIEELPHVNSHGSTIEEARRTLQELIGLAFDAARQSSRELIAGRELVREAFVIPLQPA